MPTVMTVITTILTAVFMLGLLVCAICGYATLVMSVVRKATEHKRVKLERKYLISFEDYCKAHADELTESEVSE